MICTIEQIRDIVINNPNKSLIDAGKEMATKNMRHVHGTNLASAITKSDYFENDQVYNVRKQYAISNRDMFGRLLQQEEIIFAARGGSSNFHLSEDQESEMNGILSNVRYDLSLRKWIKNFALPAYRCDPMGIFFMEVEQLQEVAEGQTPNDPKAYPTYKSIHSIHDYLPTGRRLEYVCFKLTVADAKAFGVNDPDLKGMSGSSDSPYFRFCDDAKDMIVKRVEDKVIIATNVDKNPIKNEWDRTPGFIISDLIQFDNPQLFVSPLYPVIELADCFLYDRSIRDLQKKFHGFAKAIEPLLKCSTCAGNGFVSGQPCPDCTPKGASKGIGYKLHTKVADVAKFPLEILEQGGFDFRRIFGYVTPDIESWNKQDMSLTDLENLIHMTYWGTSNQIQQQQNKETGEQKTATEVRVNNKPKEAKLNMIADWAEKTESMIADFIGRFWFDGFKSADIAYSRNYILETPAELWTAYQDMRTKGATETALDEALTKYYSALYESNPTQLAICKKLMIIEPFVHLTAIQTKGVVLNQLDFIKKLYFGDWKRKSVTTEQLLNLKPDALDKLLEDFATQKFEDSKKYAPEQTTNPIQN